MTGAAGRGEPALRDAATLLFVDDLERPRPSDDDVHHLVESLRVAAGESVAVGDGRGRYRMTTARFVPVDPTDDRRGRRRGRSSDLVLEVAGPVVETPAPSPKLTVGFGIPKGDRAEWTVQKLTEVGVDVIVPLLTARTVVRLSGDEVERRAERYRRIAREASSQCRRTWLPVVSTPCAFGDLPSTLLDSAVLAQPCEHPLTPDTTTVLVGPEGGWSEAELARVAVHAQVASHILRAETAAIAVGVLLVAVRDRLVALG